MSVRKYSFSKSMFNTGALDFSRRSDFVRETMLEKIYPTRIILPMKQHYGVEAIPTVKPGEKVTIGQCVGVPAPGTFSVPVHSGISGTCTMIKDVTLPNGVKCKAVCIESDRKRTFHKSVKPRTTIDINSRGVLGIVRNAGIVGMGGEGIPTAAKIVRATKYKVKELLVNCLQSEPFSTCDVYRACEYSDSVVRGAFALAGASGVKNIRFLVPAKGKIEKQSLECAFERATNEYPLFNPTFAEFADLFPQGNFRMVADALYGVKIGRHDILEDKCSAVMFNCSTCCAVWEAIAENMPCCSRIVTISDDYMNGHNVLVPIGTPVSELIGDTRITDESQKTVMGNALTGLLVSDPDTPVIKTTSAVTIIRKLEFPGTQCIHCGYCIQACPVGIEPGIVSGLIENGYEEMAIEQKAKDCIACGACSYICPAGKDLTGVVAKFANEDFRVNDDSYMGTTVFDMGKLDIREATLLEDFSKDDAASSKESIDPDAIVLPFEGEKTV